MQFLTDAEFAGKLLEESERNLKIAHHIQAARQVIWIMAAALLLIACVLIGEMQSADYAAVAVAAFVLGYSVRALISHLRRTAKRRRHG